MMVRNSIEGKAVNQDVIFKVVRQKRVSREDGDSDAA